MISSDFFKNSKVIITGHTGFKGSWLSLWLAKLGANVVGLSDTVPTKPAHYDLITDILYDDLRIDIKNTEDVIDKLKDFKPDFVFHLAAQPIVMNSFKDPLGTFYTNTIRHNSVSCPISSSNYISSPSNAKPYI